MESLITRIMTTTTMESPTMSMKIQTTMIMMESTML
jgi:hypothetical protein